MDASYRWVAEGNESWPHFGHDRSSMSRTATFQHLINDSQVLTRQATPSYPAKCIICINQISRLASQQAARGCL